MKSCDLITAVCCILTFLLLAIEVESREIGTEQVLIVVSYDGFRAEYLERNVTPNLLEFRRNGVYADYMKNVFPTKTFTNHHSIATGLYPSVHGVTANELYDSKLGKLRYGYELFHYDPKILPIWTLNEKAGGTSGCVMWPGSNFDYDQKNCTFVMEYNSSVPMKQRVDEMFSWLKDPKNPPNLVMLYLELPDQLAHAVGPESPKITEVLKELDSITKYIQDELKAKNLLQRANVIHLSDHGMEGVTSANFIDLTKFLEPNTFTMVGTSPVLQVVPNKGKEEEVYTKLKNAAIENGNFDVYKPSTLPSRWHIFNERRFGPIIAVANLGYAFQDMFDAAKYYQDKYNITFTPTSVYGVHGYDNAIPKMHPIFMAKGPAFKKNQKVAPFHTVDLFALFCKLLNIPNPPETAATFSNVSEVLSARSSTKIGAGGSETIRELNALPSRIIGLVIVCAVLLAVSIYAIAYYRRKRHYSVANV